MQNLKNVKINMLKFKNKILCKHFNVKDKNNYFL